MDNLLLFFAIPIATIILAIILEKQINNPLQVAAIFFAIFLVAAFAFGDSSLLIYVIAYTILAYVTAVITRLILDLLEDNNNNENCRRHNNCSTCGCSNEIKRVENEVSALNDTVDNINCLLEDIAGAQDNNDNNNDNSCGCSNQIRRVENEVAALNDTVDQINCLVGNLAANNNNGNNNATCNCSRRRCGRR